ncbi:MAG: hypothetical protein ACLGSD_03970 [Acidobacteriota bacterium]
MQLLRTLRLIGLGLSVIPAAKTQKASTSGTLNVQLTNTSAIVMLLNSNPNGIALGNTGTSAATMNFGTVSDYNSSPATGVTVKSGKTSFTASSPFDIRIEMSGSSSTSYTLSAALASTAPTGITIDLNSTTLTTTAQTITATGSYFSNTSHTLKLIISTAAPGSGGPVTGTQFTSTIDLTATAN